MNGNYFLDYECTILLSYIFSAIQATAQESSRSNFSFQIKPTLLNSRKRMPDLPLIFFLFFFLQKIQLFLVYLHTSKSRQEVHEMISVALFLNSTIWIPSSELLTAFEETLFILKIIYMYISVRGVIFIQSHTLHEIFFRSNSLNAKQRWTDTNPNPFDATLYF